MNTKREQKRIVKDSLSSVRAGIVMEERGVVIDLAKYRESKKKSVLTKKVKE